MKKILIVEDSLSAIENLQRCLKEVGEFNLKIATHYKAAINLIETEKFDIIICDHNFPIFQNSQPEPLGTDILFELACEDFNGIFIHHSLEPQPELYQDHTNNMKFYSFEKNSPKMYELLKSLK